MFELSGKISRWDLSDNLSPDNKAMDAAGLPYAAKAEVTVFFREILDRGLSLRVKVTGRSMAPFLKGGDVVTLKKVPHSKLRKGDIIFIDSHRGSPLLHRLVRRRRVGKGDFIFQTRGDALKSFDIPVVKDEILGRVCHIERVRSVFGVERLDMESFVQRKMNYLRALYCFFGSCWYYGRMRLLALKTSCKGKRLLWLNASGLQERTECLNFAGPEKVRAVTE